MTLYELSTRQRSFSSTIKAMFYFLNKDKLELAKNAKYKVRGMLDAYHELNIITTKEFLELDEQLNKAFFNYSEYTR